MGSKKVYYDKIGDKMQTMLCARIPLDVHLKLEKLAALNDSTVSSLVRSLLYWYVEHYKDVVLSEDEW